MASTHLSASTGAATLPKQATLTNLAWKIYALLIRETIKMNFLNFYSGSREFIYSIFINSFHTVLNKLLYRFSSSALEQNLTAAYFMIL